MKAWEVVVDGEKYTIKPKGGKLVINDEKVKLKSLMSRKEGLFRVYEVPVGAKKAQLYVNNWVGGTRLAMDGLDCATGKPFTPPKMPAWGYIFMVIHCINFINGAVGVLLAIAGVAATIAVTTNTKLPLAARILLDIVLVVLFYIVVFGVAIAANSIIYG